jgi:hypothetical protein
MGSLSGPKQVTRLLEVQSFTQPTPNEEAVAQVLSADKD